MVPVAQVHDAVLEPGRRDGVVHLAVHLAHQSQTEGSLEGRILQRLVSQDFPENERIAVGGQQARVDDVEKAIRVHGLVKVAAVVAVGDHRHGRGRLRLELLLHERRDGQHGGALVQHGLFHRLQPPPSAF